MQQTHEMLFDAHNHACRALGGAPRRGIYNNMRTTVDKVGRGKERGRLTRGLRPWSAISCLRPRSATLPPAGRKDRSKRMSSRPAQALAGDAELSLACDTARLAGGAMPGTVVRDPTRSTRRFDRRRLARGGTALDATSSTIQPLRRIRQAGLNDLSCPSGTQSL